MGSRTPNYFGARLVPISRREKYSFWVIENYSDQETQMEVRCFSTWEVLRDAFIRGTLASTNINSLPTKQPCVHGPCAGSKHDEAYSQRREQEVQVRSVSSRKENPNLDDHLQSSGN